MNKYEALEQIREAWNNPNIDLGQKILSISSAYYEVGLDIEMVAAYIKATPAEIDALISLSDLDIEVINRIAKINPPKTTWQLIANASDEERNQALDALNKIKEKDAKNNIFSTMSEYVYQQMIEVAGQTPEQMVGMLTSIELDRARKKGEDFNALSEWELNFMKGIVRQKKRGKVLTTKQLPVVLRILSMLADRGVITRNSIDGDKDVCDRILDALGK